MNFPAPRAVGRLRFVRLFQAHSKYSILASVPLASFSSFGPLELACFCRARRLKAVSTWCSLGALGMLRQSPHPVRGVRLHNLRKDMLSPGGMRFAHCARRSPLRQRKAERQEVNTTSEKHTGPCATVRLYTVYTVRAWPRQFAATFLQLQSQRFEPG